MKTWHAAILLLILMMLAAAAHAADADRQTELLQAALNACQQQTQEANARALERIATLTVDLAKAQKRIAELEKK